MEWGQDCSTSMQLRHQVVQIRQHLYLHKILKSFTLLHSALAPCVSKLSIIQQVLCSKKLRVQDSYINVTIQNSTISDGHRLPNIFIEDCDAWLLPNGETNAGFTLDYGCSMLLTRIDLRNARTDGTYDRGTKDFEVLASGDGSDWTAIVSGVLSCTSGINCDDPNATIASFFPSTGPMNAREA